VGGGDLFDVLSPMALGDENQNKKDHDFAKNFT
jgi:hypothetical protein